jgi:hypothetical protein
MRWSDAKLCAILDRHDLFSRSKPVLEKYDEYKAALERNQIKIEDVIRKNMNGAPIKWMRNAFPYDVDESRHYLIWCEMPLAKEKIQEVASTHVGTLEYFCFINPEERRSVNGLWHAHCLVRRG